jgi:hypothetical protein
LAFHLSDRDPCRPLLLDSLPDVVQQGIPHQIVRLTLKRAIVRIGGKENQIGLTYVGCSRVKPWDSLAFYHRFPWERMEKINKACGIDQNTGRDTTPYKFSNVVMIVLNESEVNTTSLKVSARRSLWQLFPTQVCFGFKQFSSHLTAARGPSKKIGLSMLLYPIDKSNRCSRSQIPTKQRHKECRVERQKERIPLTKKICRDDREDDSESQMHKSTWTTTP